MEAPIEKTVAVKKPVAKSYTPNMDQIELPTVLRRKQQQALLDGKAAPVTKAKAKTEDMFDVPTFLRRRSE